MFKFGRYRLIGEWKKSTGGMVVFAEAGGEKFFLKQYSTPIQPSRESVKNGTLTEKSYKRSSERFERFMKMRTTINEKLNEKAGKGGNIICPIEWGVVDGKFVEATEYVPGLIEDKETIFRIPEEEKMLILLSVMAALVSVHKLNIVHGDIKFKNVAVTEKESVVAGKKNYVGKLIDFDCSFLKDVELTSVGGDQVYMSPEFCMCWMTEMSPKYLKEVDFKADIFSMGILFHEYMSGTLPIMGAIPEKISGKDRDKIYYCEYILYGGEPQVSKSITNKRLADLIKRMLQLDPEKRPTAMETLEELKIIKKEIEGKSGGGTVVSGGSVEPVKEKPRPTGFETPWDEHAIEYVEAEISRMKYISCKRIEILGKKAYEFYRNEGAPKRYTKETLIAAGMAKTSGATGTKTSGEIAEPVPHTTGFEAPWEEHAIEYVEAEISRMKYVSCKRIEVAGKKAYEFCRKEGALKRYTKETLIATGLARPIGVDGVKASGGVVEPVPHPAGFETPWEEHCIEYVEAEVLRMKYVSCKRIEVAGKKAYEFYRENGVAKRYTVENLISVGMAKKI